MRFCNLLALFAGWALLGAAILVTIEVFGRKFFGFSLQGADEIAGYTLALASTAGFSYALLQRRHIRVDLLVRKFTTRARTVVHLIAYLTMAGFATLLCFRAAAVFAESLEFQARSVTPLRTPLILPQGLWLAASAIFMLVAIFMVLRLTCLMFRRKWDAADREFAITDDAVEGANSDDGAAR